MSIKKNFLYNSILTLSGYFFPLLTYPYVSRVLGVSNIGICNFIDSIVNYFMLFSMMGIATVGMREIALHRDNRQEMSRHFSGLIVLNLTSTILAIIVLIGSMYLVPALFPYRRLLFIGVCKLFFNLKHILIYSVYTHLCFHRQALCSMLMGWCTLMLCTRSCLTLNIQESPRFDQN